MAVLSIVLSALAVLSSLGALLLLFYLVATLRKVPRFSPPLVSSNFRGNPLPLVSVIVTAKNEEQMIARCLRSLLAQPYPNLEIIVVDDSSSDNTRNVASQFSVSEQSIRVLDAGQKPEGWIGKSWPCWRGYESSKGTILLFVDADSTLDKSQTIEASVNYLQDKDLDMFSIAPKVRLKGTWASATIPIVSGAINILYPLAKVNDENSERAYVFGTFILVRKGVYEAIDGHRAVKDLIVEDAAIARRAKSAGYKLRVENATEYLSTDWEHEFSAIYSGLERVTSTSIRSYGLASILNAVLLFFLALYSIIFILGSFVLFITGSQLLLTSPDVQVGFAASVLNVLFILAIVSRELMMLSGRIGLLPFLYPLGMAIFISAIVTTSIKVTRGKA